MEERLQKFVKLVEAGSFTKAAKLMHISQPALTVAVAKLERELGTQLLVRDTRPLELTAAGRLAYEAGVSQGVILDNLQTGLRDLAGQRLSVRIGLVDSVAATLFVHSAPFTELEKKADVSVIVNDSHHLQHAVNERSLDAAVLVGGDQQGTNGEKFADELMVLVCAPHMVATRQVEIAKGQVSNFISYDQPSRTAELIQRGLFEQGLVAASRLQSSSPEVMCRMVVSGTGVAVLPYIVVRSMLITKTLSVLTKEGNAITIVRRLGLAEPPGKKQAKVVGHFIDEMKAALIASYDEAVVAVASIKAN